MGQLKAKQICKQASMSENKIQWGPKATHHKPTKPILKQTRFNFVSPSTAASSFATSDYAFLLNETKKL